MYPHSHAHTHTHALIHKHTHTHTHTHAHTHTHTHTLTHTSTSGQGDWRKSFQQDKGFQGRFEGTNRECVTDRSGELVPCCWSLVKERAPTTWFCAKELYSEHSGVCRRTELLRRSVKVKIWEVGRRNQLWTKQAQIMLYHPNQVSLRTTGCVHVVMTGLFIFAVNLFYTPCQLDVFIHASGITFSTVKKKKEKGYVTLWSLQTLCVSEIHMTFKGKTKSNDKWAWKPSKCVKTSGYVCYGSLCSSHSKKIQFILLILPPPACWHVDACACVADRFWHKKASKTLDALSSVFFFFQRTILVPNCTK